MKNLSNEQLCNIHNFFGKHQKETVLTLKSKYHSEIIKIYLCKCGSWSYCSNDGHVESEFSESNTEEFLEAVLHNLRGKRRKSYEAYLYSICPYLAKNSQGSDWKEYWEAVPK